MLNSILNNLTNACKDEQPTDYIDEETGLIYCGICHKPKQTIMSCVAMGNPKVWIACDCKKAEWDKENEERTKEKRFQAAAMLRDKCFDVGKERCFTFNCDDSPNCEESRKVRHWAENFSPSRNEWLLLYGGCGGGKSFYAAAICNAVIDMGYSARFTTISSIERQIWKAEDKEGAYKHIVEQPQLLVIDDFGAERDTDYMEGVIFDIIDHRYRSDKPTVITTNKTPAEILMPKGINEQRVMSRIAENLKPILINHPDRRIEAFKKSIE